MHTIIECRIYNCFPLTFRFSVSYQDEISDCLAVVKVLKIFFSLQEINCTLFLLAGYAKYGQPYAWIRSNHERLVNVGGTDTLVKDTPMKLKSITDWVSTSQGFKTFKLIYFTIFIFYWPYFHNFIIYNISLCSWIKVWKLKKKNKQG